MGKDVLGDPCAHMPRNTRTVLSRFRTHASIPTSSTLMLDSPKPGPTDFAPSSRPSPAPPIPTSIPTPLSTPLIQSHFRVAKQVPARKQETRGGGRGEPSGGGKTKGLNPRTTRRGRGRGGEPDGGKPDGGGQTKGHTKGPGDAQERGGAPRAVPR